MNVEIALVLGMSVTPAKISVVDNRLKVETSNFGSGETFAPIQFPQKG